MTVSCDLGDLQAFTRANLKALSSVPNRMLSVAKAFANEERASHTYQNRTGDLESSTRAVDVGTFADSATVDLCMGDDRATYASYVVARGFSSFPDIAKRCGQFMGVALGQVADVAAK